MINKFLLPIALVLVSLSTFAQKAQKVGYLDMEYILENVPEYTAAQSKLDAKINKWNDQLTKRKNEIDKLTADLNNEKALLTADLINERQEDIDIKKKDYRQAQQNYFGPTGELFLLRKQIVKPVQDQIYNAVQEIVKAKKYDFIFDKSSDLLMLYSNKKYDVSELVLNKIVKGRKLKENKKKKKDRIDATLSKQELMKQKIKDRKAKAAALREKIKKDQQKRLKIKDSIRKVRAAERLKRMEDAKNKRNGVAKPKTTPKSDTKVKESVKKEKAENVERKDTKAADTVETNESVKKPKQETAKEKKRRELLERIAKQKAKRDSLKQVALEKRKKRLAEIKNRKKKLQEKKNKNN